MLSKRQSQQQFSSELPHPDDHTIRTTDTPGFKPFTMLIRTVTTARKVLDILLDLTMVITLHLTRNDKGAYAFYKSIE